MLSFYGYGLGVLNFLFTCLTWSVGDFVAATTSQPLEDKHGIFASSVFD
jgi:hypothetical protein